VKTVHPVSRARLSIDLDALAHNYAVLVKASGGAKVAPVVKADGYGLGAAPLAWRLWTEGARSFFVARLVEGEALRAAMAGREAEILVLDGVDEASRDRFLAARLTPVLNTLEQARAWAGRPAALHVDTGMNRLGLTLEDAQALAGHADIRLVMSHLGNAANPADQRNRDQLARFHAARALFPAASASLAASAGAFLGPDYLFDLTRPGISLLGGGPREVPDDRLRAVATLDAPILQLRDLKAGEHVGYGAMFEAPRDMRIAVIEAGYADGLLRGSHARGAAYLNGSRAPFAMISMDLMAIDVSHCPAAVGDRVELLGPNALLDNLAAAAGSVAHECLVRLSTRAERVYVGKA
jgi:alanine racemase